MRVNLSRTTRDRAQSGDRNHRHSRRPPAVSRQRAVNRGRLRLKERTEQFAGEVTPCGRTLENWKVIFCLLMPGLRRRHASKQREVDRAALDNRVVALSVAELQRNESRRRASTVAFVGQTARSRVHSDPLLCQWKIQPTIGWTLAREIVAGLHSATVLIYTQGGILQLYPGIRNGQIARRCREAATP